MPAEPLTMNEYETDTDDRETLSQNGQMLGIAIYGGLVLVGFFFGIVTGYDTPKPIVVAKREKDKDTTKPDSQKPSPKVTLTPPPKEELPKEEPKKDDLKKEDPKPDPKPEPKKDEFHKETPRLDPGTTFQNTPANFKQVVESPQKFESQYFVFEGDFGAASGNLKREKDLGWYTLAFQSQGKSVAAAGALDKDRMSFVVAEDVGSQLMEMKEAIHPARIYCQVRFAKPDSKTYPIAFVFRLEFFEASASRVTPKSVVPAKSPPLKANPPFKTEEPKKETPVAVKAVSFEKDIKPILRSYCFNCHGGAGKPKGDVNLTTLAKITEKGAPDILKPGDPKKSALQHDRGHVDAAERLAAIEGRDGTDPRLDPGRRETAAAETITFQGGTRSLRSRKRLLRIGAANEFSSWKPLAASQAVASGLTPAPTFG